MLVLILALLGIVAGFFVIELGIILEVIVVFIARKQMKNKVKYANYAYYISLIVGIVQLILWVAEIAYAVIAVNNITKEAKEEIDEINKKYEVILEYKNICSEKIDINDYNSFDEYDKAYDECNDIIDECFDKYENLDEAKKCADKIK